MRFWNGAIDYTGTQLTCFTGTKVQMLTQNLQTPSGMARIAAEVRAADAAN